mmetsp:Transcript_48158/g.133822  ORF Transcript_48158/g.133822 Transcript_48158/m.133822 type:complete len:279 (-) Transcript_48158:748-1584(-)
MVTLVLPFPNNKVIEANSRRTSLGSVPDARTLAIHAKPIHPRKVWGVPVADDRCHACSQNPRELYHPIAALVVVLVKAQLEGAEMALLRQRDLHGFQKAVLDGEVHLDVEGPGRVDALCARSVLGVAPVAPPDPANAPAVAGVRAAGVVVHVDVGGPGVLVGVLDADLSAGHPTALPAVSAEKVVALRFLDVVVHGEQVKAGVATATHLGEIRGVAHCLSKQLPGHVFHPVVLASVCNGALVTKVCPAIEMRDDGPILVRHLHTRGLLARQLPLRGHD